MSSRAALYQTKLTGYFRVKAQSTPADDVVSHYHADEGRHWWPINVDSGSRTDPIDVEWWTALRTQPAQQAGHRGPPTLGEGTLLLPELGRCV